MFDTRVGRFISEDPSGFAAGDPNLFRYVGNNPTNATDPTGLQRRVDPIYGTWDFWANEARSSLDISYSSRESVVRGAISSLDSSFALRQIPWVDPRIAVTSNVTIGTPAPVFYQVRSDESVPRENYSVPLATPAQLARINIRVNLLNIKQALVTQLYHMVWNNQGDRQIDSRRLAIACNAVADNLIRMTDRFLSTHTGAQPLLGRRGSHFFGDMGATRQSHPWCADWAEAMDTWIRNQIIRGGENHPGNEFFNFSWGQCNYNGQHNFIIISPANHSIRYSRPNTNIVDRTILLFDPWRELLPKLYNAEPLNANRNSAPTQLFIPRWLEEPYYSVNDP